MERGKDRKADEGKKGKEEFNGNGKIRDKVNGTEKGQNRMGREREKESR